MTPRVLLTVALLAITACVTPHPQPKTADSLRLYAADARIRQLPEPPASGSLWSPSGVPLYTDFKARRVGDIVIVRVDEATDAASGADTKSSRKSEVGGGIKNLFEVQKQIKFLGRLATGDGATSQSGSGSTTRKNSLTTTVAATVAEVLPNGALLIEARRRVAFNHDSQMVAMVGVVRGSDIAADGSVASSQVSDLELIVDGRGVVDEAERPAWLYRLLTATLPL